MSLKNWAAFALLAVVWGSSFLWIKVAVQAVGPFTLVAFRLLFGALFLGAVLAVKRPPWPRQPAAWAALAFFALVNTAAPFVLISWGEQYIDSALASILNGAVPLFTLFIAHWFLREERMTWARLLGLLAGFAGIAVLVSRGLGPGALQGELPGTLAVLGAALLYAVGIVFARRRLRAISPMVQALAAALFGDFLIWLGVAAWEAPLRLPPDPLVWTALGILGFLGTGLAYLLFFYLIQTVGPTRASLVTYVMPLVGVALGITFLGEPLSWRLALGTSLILGAVWAVNAPFRLRRLRA